MSLKIIRYFQVNKIECNNEIIDKIFYETNENKKAALIKAYKSNQFGVDLNSTGYIVELFKIFKNIDNFYIKERKTVECILCGFKENKEVLTMDNFIKISKEQ